MGGRARIRVVLNGVEVRTGDRIAVEIGEKDYRRLNVGTFAGIRSNGALALRRTVRGQQRTELFEREAFVGLVVRW